MFFHKRPAVATTMVGSEKINERLLQEMKQETITYQRHGLIKGFAMLVCVVYLAQPFGKQLADVVHLASHFMAPPKTVIGHQANIDFSAHDFEKHTLGQEHHTHIFDGLMDALMDEPNSKDGPKDTAQKKFKVHKHLITERTSVQRNAMGMPLKLVCDLNEKLLQGHSPGSFKPPQLSKLA